MESTIPKGRPTDYQLEIDILRRRWTTIGIRFTEDELERAVRANAKSRLKRQAKAASSDDEEDEAAAAASTDYVQSACWNIQQGCC